jgi:hypothetical protein
VDIALTSTWLDIASRLDREQDPLRILRLLNLITRRCWKLAVWFDASGHNVLTVNTAPPLGTEDLQFLLSGVVPEALACEHITFCDGAGVSLAATPYGSLQGRSRSNTLSFSSSDPAQAGLAFVGLYGRVLPAVLQQDDAVARYAYEHTWLGGGWATPHVLEWSLLGHGTTLGIRDRLTERLGSIEIPYSVKASLLDDSGQMMGNVRALTHGLFKGLEFYHRSYGRISVGDAQLRRWSAELGTWADWCIEIDEPALRPVPGEYLEPHSRFTEICNRAVRTIASAQSTGQFGDFLADVANRRQEMAAQRLVKRQQSVSRGPRVCFAGQPIMGVPRSENETVALLCKLEALRALPFHSFTLVEYTARRGIDCLAHFQQSSAHQQHLFAPVEIEYTFENFFDHGHFEGQVSLVICWSMQGSAPGRLDPIAGGLYRYLTEDGDSFLLLVLSELKELTIEGGWQ